MIYLAFALNLAALVLALRVAVDRGVSFATYVNAVFCITALMIIWPSVRNRLRR